MKDERDELFGQELSETIGKMGEMVRKTEKNHKGGTTEIILKMMNDSQGSETWGLLKHKMM